jgi:hypothetical protein
LGNGADVGPDVRAGEIASSLISDGTFDGLNGNFAATPLVDASLALLPGSPGIDAGNDAGRRPRAARRIRPAAHPGR